MDIFNSKNNLISLSSRAGENYGDEGNSSPQFLPPRTEKGDFALEKNTTAKSPFFYFSSKESIESI